MKVGKCLKYIDIYGEPIQFNIKGSKYSKTLIGGILTIITVCLIIAAAWNTGNDIFYHNQPNINIEDMKLMLS